MKWIKSFAKLCVFLSSLLAYCDLNPCTNFLVVSKDQSLINGRSMEFGLELNSEIIIHPQGEKRNSIAPNGEQGLSWKSKYGLIGVNALKLDIIVDGFNEKGLSCGALWFPSAKYQNVSPNESSKALAIEDFGLWVLGNFATVSEVKQALSKIKIWGHPIEALGGEPPLHIILHDATGESLVIEFIDGKVITYNNPGGTLTNYPSFDWQMINLENYVNLTAVNQNPVNLQGTTIKPTGQGSGLIGIPGDWSPPSRFVRISLLKQFAIPPENAKQAVYLAAHLLNAMDIPKGDIRVSSDSVEGDYTQWIVIKDITNNILYFRTYDNLTLKAIDLKKVDLSKGSLKVSMNLGEEVVDVTQELHEIMPTFSVK